MMARRRYATANGILAAARECGLDEASFHQLPGGRAQELLDSVLDSFTTRGRVSRMHYWIWEDLRPPTLSLPAPDELGVLLTLGPPSTPVWLIVEDWDGTKRGAPFWIFEATHAAAIAMLKNHHPLEFYIVSRPLMWLVGENHHDVLFAAGEPAISVFQTIGR
jgi:hypothetical protein